LKKEIQECGDAQKEWKEAAQPMVTMHMEEFGKKNTFFQQFTFLYSVRAGTLYAPVAGKAVQLCMPKQNEMPSWDTYREYMDCLKRPSVVPPHEGYVRKYANKNEEVLIRRILLNYLQGILKEEGLLNLNNAAEKMQHLMQVTMLNHCEDHLTSSEVLYCMVCQWYKYSDEEFGKFTNIANNAAKKTHDEYISGIIGMPGLNSHSPYIIYDMEGLKKNYINNPLDVNQWKTKCRRSAIELSLSYPLPLEGTYYHLRRDQHYQGVPKLFEEYDINSYTLKRLQQIWRLNKEAVTQSGVPHFLQEVPKEIDDALTDTGKKRALMNVLLNFGMRVPNPMTVNDCYRKNGQLWLA